MINSARQIQLTPSNSLRCHTLGTLTWTQTVAYAAEYRRHPTAPTADTLRHNTEYQISTHIHTHTMPTATHTHPCSLYDDDTDTHPTAPTADTVRHHTDPTVNTHNTDNDTSMHTAIWWHRHPTAPTAYTVRHPTDITINTCTQTTLIPTPPCTLHHDDTDTRQLPQATLLDNNTDPAITHTTLTLTHVHTLHDNTGIYTCTHTLNHYTSAHDT